MGEEPGHCLFLMKGTEGNTCIEGNTEGTEGNTEGNTCIESDYHLLVLSIIKKHEEEQQ